MVIKITLVVICKQVQRHELCSIRVGNFRCPLNKVYLKQDIKVILELHYKLGLNFVSNKMLKHETHK